MVPEGSARDRIQLLQYATRIYVRHGGTCNGAAIARNIDAMISVKLCPKMSALVADIIQRKEPVFNRLNFITEAPLLDVGCIRAQRKLAYAAPEGKAEFLAGGRGCGKRIASWIPGIRVGQSSRRTR